jgi:hypothetical protein
MAGEKLVNVKADTAADFLDNAHKAMHDANKLGETTYDLEITGVKLDPKTKTVIKGSFKLTTETTRVHWAGPVKTPPDKPNAHAIEQIEAMNADHEKNHRDSYQQAFDKAKGALEKEMVGKTEKELKDVLQEMKDKLLDACEKLHKSEGLITVTQKADGSITVSESAEGPGGCK